MTSCRALIFGCSGTRLTRDEAAFYRDVQPWGFILFKRNIGTPEEVRRLTDALRESVGRADAPILIDQEGGRVQRMGPPHWPKYPAGNRFSRLNGLGEAMAWLGARLIAHDLNSVGINVDCAPMLDVPIAGTHDIIGDRAYSTEAELVATLGRAFAEGLMAGGVLPVIKHIPGHGRATSDSHERLPVVEADRETLAATDFQPFRALADLPIAMSGHVLYTAIDRRGPATQSATVIGEIVRKQIGFDGLLLSDDLSMKALKGSYRKRAEKAYSAGIDVALHCNGKMRQMCLVAEAAPMLQGEALRRTDAALARIAGKGEGFDVAEARSRFEIGIAAAA